MEMDWKAILALALLAVPLTYCTIEDTRERERARVAIETACIEQRGTISSWSLRCTFND
jgi:hypothetical protein